MLGAGTPAVFNHRPPPPPATRQLLVRCEEVRGSDRTGKGAWGSLIPRTSQVSLALASLTCPQAMVQVAGLPVTLPKATKRREVRCHWRQTSGLREVLSPTPTCVARAILFPCRRGDWQTTQKAEAWLLLGEEEGDGVCHGGGLADCDWGDWWLPRVL